MQSAACVSCHKGLSLHLVGCRSSCLFSRRKSQNSHWARRILQQLPQSRLVQKSLPRYVPHSEPAVKYCSTGQLALRAVHVALAGVQDPAQAATSEQRHQTGLAVCLRALPLQPSEDFEKRVRQSAALEDHIVSSSKPVIQVGSLLSIFINSTVGIMRTYSVVLFASLSACQPDIASVSHSHSVLAS